MERIDLLEHETPLILRTLNNGDIPKLTALQKICFAGISGTEEAAFRSQISVFPEGQFCIECRGELIATCSSMIIDFDETDDIEGYDSITSDGYITKHNPYGDTLYGIEIMVHPEYRGMKLARRLYEARKQIVREKNLKRIVVGGRIPGYRNYASEMSAREYVEQVANRSIYDPVLTAQLANGFTIQKLIRSYLAEDKDSAGYATLLEWLNLDFEAHPKRAPRRYQRARVCIVQFQVRQIKDLQAFERQCEYFASSASEHKSDFLVFPEAFSTELLSMFSERDPARAVRRLAQYTPELLSIFSRLAVRYDVNIIGGSLFTLESESLYNVSYLFRRDGTIEKQTKLRISPGERRWWGVRAGEKINVFDTDRGKISIMLSQDIEAPELCRSAIEQGAEIIFVPFCVEEHYAYLRIRYCSQARAIENGVYVVLSGLAGSLPTSESMDIQYAQSGIYTPSDFAFPKDAIAAECLPNIETVIVHDLDLALLDEHRRRERALPTGKPRELFVVTASRDDEVEELEVVQA